MIRGTTVTLYERTPKKVDGVPVTDAFHAQIYDETPVRVENVLIGEPSSDEITTATDLYGKRILFMLGIPKGDAHDWTDARVSWTMPNGATMTVRTFGFPIAGIEANVPGPWHMKMRCGAYE